MLKKSGVLSIGTLRDKSIAIIMDNQYPTGAYIASPNFPMYSYCWLRDGTFTAYSMDRFGEHQSARKFYLWVDKVIERYADKINTLITKDRRDLSIKPNEFLHTRYKLDGSECADDWQNFQLDGYGTWLWGLAEHINITGDNALITKFSESIRLTINYLKHFWFTPNYDCWEEFNNQIHPSTLACIYGGLKSINQFIHDREIPDICIKIRELILRKGVYKGRITKYFGSTSIDANLLWLIVPFRMFEPADEITKRTIEDIEKKLYTEGVHRYPEDTYYGGGEWILLTAWLGWYYCQVGELGKARKLLSWIEKQADEKGNLPEQVPNNLNNPDYYSIWIKEWGKIAKPLLWSHAMYLVLDKELEERREYNQNNL